MSKTYRFSFVGLVLALVLILNTASISAVRAGGEGEGPAGLPPGSKVVNTAYFNQWLEPNGTKFPADGWQMCGAASGVIALSKFNKPLTYNGNDHDFKLYMYKDSFIDGTKTPICGVNKGGAFTLTNSKCNQNYLGGIENYVKKYGRSWSLLSKNIAFVKQAIDRGHPVIFNFTDSTDSSFGHIATIVGYTSSNKIIVNDTYTNVQNLGRGWKSYYTGKFAIYDLNSTRYPIGYLLEVL